MINSKVEATITTSLRQGRSREGGSEGSQRQSCEPTDRNVIECRDSWVSWHNTTKPTGSGSTVNGAVAQRQVTVLSGEVFPAAAWSAKGVGLRPVSKGAEQPPNPTVLTSSYGSRTECHLEGDGRPTESYGDSGSPADGNVSGVGQKSCRGHSSCNSIEGPNRAK